jgi:penicillin-binding protein 1B
MSSLRRKPLARRLAAGLAITIFGVLVYAAALGIYVTLEFEQRGWDVPARVYAAPLELYAGRLLSRDDLVTQLERLGYARADDLASQGSYRVAGDVVELHSRRAGVGDDVTDPLRLRIEFSAGRVAAVSDADGRGVAIAQLDPLLIGSIFPAHGEDRLIIAPEEIPSLLTEALKAVEDRRFESHIGVDPRAILRAAWVNIEQGEIQQGASTLTQQLVRSYFLSNEQTWSRKLHEALMAIALELRYSKDALMSAYVNEVYLAQDGGRAIHGFGLASRFYFGRPLPELELHEIALLIAQVRGPSYYDPRRHPERALARRNLVLRQMAELELITAATHDAARARELGIVGNFDKRSSYYAGFLDLVRRQLGRDYPREELEAKGLTVYSTLDPSVQAIGEASLLAGIDALQPGRPELEGAVIVMQPASGEVQALVGSRRTGLDGFNRALDARRPVGSLIKPVVYLAALESERYSLANLVADESVTIVLDDGRSWAPSNFDGESHGTVTLLRALAESFNQATVRLGMDVGVEAVAESLGRFGLERRFAPFPSLLLGAVELTPYDVAQIYATFANGGFRIPPKAVRRIVDAAGVTLQRYPLAIEPVAAPEDIYAVNQALVQVMERGTGRSARTRLPDALRTAGKTGTSDGFRDAWFAGFTNGHLVLTWLGNDGNAPIGLTGAAGAGSIWSDIVGKLETTSYDAPPPSGTNLVWIDYVTGLATDGRCPDAVALPIGNGDVPPTAAACGSDRLSLGSKLRGWFERALQ